jgi:hypothetical protein
LSRKLFVDSIKYNWKYTKDFWKEFSSEDNK